MNGRTFGSPLQVKDGAFVREIACLDDALEFLYDWPPQRRGPIYETARRACQRALEGQHPVEIGRSAFAAFARSARILVESPGVMPWMTTPNNQKGGMPA